MKPAAAVEGTQRRMTRENSKDRSAWWAEEREKEREESVSRKVILY